MKKGLINAVSIAVGLGLAACNFTGIEKTDRITLSKAELASHSKRTDEEKLMEALKDTVVSKWRRNKPFLCTSDKVKDLFVVAPEEPDGMTLYYSDYELTTTPLGENALNIEFRDSLGRSYIYQKEFLAASQLTNLQVPMFIDLDLVKSADSLLRGKTLWPKTSLWQDAQQPETRIQGLQMKPVRVESVTFGQSDFPLRVIFVDNAGHRGSLLVSPLSKSSRSFGSQFSMSDPRKLYPSITDKRWEEICEGRVSNGMTKQEVRLSLGAPDEIETNTDISRPIEIWRYSNGRYLQFQDGLLTSYHN